MAPWWVVFTEMIRLSLGLRHRLGLGAFNTVSGSYDGGN